MNYIGTFRLKEKTMFVTDTIIDTIQTAKKTAITTFVKHEGIAKSLTEWVDAETTIAKDVVKVGTKTATTLGSELTKAAQEAAKVDYTKQFTTWAQDWQKAFKPAK
jgi:hypothetical protein